MHFNNFFQNAYVTRSLDFAVEQARKQHGIEKFIFFEPDMEVYTAAHGRGPCKVKVALAWVGDLQLEFIEPVSGLVQHYLDYLPKDKSDNSLRFHHMCMRWMNWDEARAEVDRNKWPVVYEGGVEGVKFVYLDARATLGHYLEYLWASDEMWAYMSAR